MMSNGSNQSIEQKHTVLRHLCCQGIRIENHAQDTTTYNLQNETSSSCGMFRLQSTSTSPLIFSNKWVRSRRCGCFVTWFCYQLIAKPGNKTAAPSWPDPNILDACNLFNSRLFTKLFSLKKLPCRYKPYCNCSMERWICYMLCLTHWGSVTHICVSTLTVIGSDNGLLPGRRQAIIWTNARILLIKPLGTTSLKF